MIVVALLYISNDFVDALTKDGSTRQLVALGNFSLLGLAPRFRYLSFAKISLKMTAFHL